MAQIPRGVVVPRKICVPDLSCKTADSIVISDVLAATEVASSSWTVVGGTLSTGGTSTTGSTINVSFATPGVKQFTLLRKFKNGTDTTYSFPINVGDRPPQFTGWRHDTTICKGDKIVLNPYQSGPTPSGVIYRWFPKGDSTQTIRVDSSGCYSVEVSYKDGCSTQDRIYVDVCGEQPQKQGVKWFFGGNAGLDFQGGSPKALDNGKLNTIEGTSSIADTKGKLLFYTDGISVYDRNGNKMPSLIPNDTTKLGGNIRSTQSALIVPKPVCNGCDYLYYVYTTAEIRGTRQLTYSVVDMRYNKGNGAIIDRNIPVGGTTPSTERSASVRNDRDTTYWAITHDYGTNCFRVNHLTRAESATAATYCVGTAHDTPQKGEGQMKVGPATDTTNKGQRPLAVVIPGDTTKGKETHNFVELLNFNDSTGKVTEPLRRIDLGPAPPKAYGVEFSPDGKTLYVSMLADTNANGSLKGLSYILRYDLTQPSDSLIKSSKTVVDSSSTRQYGSLQVAPDGKIYVAIKDNPSLGVILNPNGGLLDSLKFQADGINLGGKISQLGLPNQVANFNEKSNSPGLAVSDTCAGQPTTFQITPNCQKLKEQYTLNFGDGSAPKSFTQASPQVHTYTNPGSYTATLRILTKRADGGICKDTLVKAPITILAVPDTVKLGPDVEVCDLRGKLLDIGVKAKFYIWLYNRRVVARTKTFQAYRSGEYIGLAANGGCFNGDTIRLLFRIPQRLNLGPDTSYCQGRTYALSVPQKAFNTFAWSTGETSATIAVGKPGAYSVTGSYKIGDVTCVARDTINIAQRNNPTLTAALTNPAGCTTVDGAIALTPSPAGSFVYSWTTIAGTPISTSTSSASALTQGDYRVRATDIFTCYRDSTFALRTKVPPLQLTTQATPQQCDKPGSGSATLGVSGGVPILYEWRDKAGNIVSTTASLSGVSAGVYSVSVADNLGCVSSLSAVPIGLNTVVALDLGPDRSKCLGDTVLLLSPAVAGGTYRWSNGVTSSSNGVNTSGTYSLTLTNTANGCVGTDAVAVQFVAKPSVSAGNNLSLCLGAPGSLTSLQLSGSSPGGGIWSGPNVDPGGQFTPSPALIGQTITLTYSVTANGCANSAPRQVALKPTPVVTPLTDLTFCEGAGRTVQATGSPGAVFRWSDGTQGSLLRPTQTGRYVVIVDLAGCEQTDDVQVTVDPAPRFSLTREAVICVGDRQQAQLRVVPQSPNQTVRWTTTGESTTAITVGSVGTYSVVVTGSNGCVASDAARVVDLCEPRLQTPNAFSPNGDGNNDKFGPLYAYTTDLEVRIYNRWGEVIFASTPDKPDWDGTYKGEPVQSMVYPYVISYRSQYFPERPAVVKRGSVLLLR
ncbi:gliding motility-associated C-terminal domain-containing protein [Fibrella sp. HMF5335]|uniref:Gliding motility-associated C-terminal domain-containing protein n=1 Tax=Fibrella rubiginis TaxID=2817060 RepID=A0A939GJD6_9BACT|nr:gliding motility-associated C-terminal domain-containing protein [Fibrella rubiginis]MBO0937851.1 gliding motility-associated C-terminal domain-containing protein [Fibrella rubiginis]